MGDGKEIILQVIATIVQVLTVLIVIDALLTWFPAVNTRSPLVVLLRKVTEPIYRPFRALIPPRMTGYVDLSPGIALLVIYVLATVIQRLIVGL